MPDGIARQGRPPPSHKRERISARRGTVAIFRSVRRIDSRRDRHPDAEMVRRRLLRINPDPYGQPLNNLREITRGVLGGYVCEGDATCGREALDMPLERDTGQHVHPDRDRLTGPDAAHLTAGISASIVANCASAVAAS